MNEKSDKLALEVLNYARDSLLLTLRFMSSALYKLELVPSERLAFATDAQRLMFTPKRVFDVFQAEPQTVSCDFLHAVLHCVFHHTFVGAKIHSAVWDLACDIAIENSISELNLPTLKCSRESRQKKTINELKSAGVEPLTAERIYRHYLDFAYDDEYINNVRRDFYADDHSPWYAFPGKSPSDEDEDDERSSGGGSGDGDGESSNSDSPTPNSEDKNANAPNEEARATREELEENWKQVAERIQAELEHSSKQWGDAAGALTQNLRDVTRERYDYSEFLRRFAVLGEDMKINDDEFDYVFYTYGLKLYENLPLVEPLEYREVKLVRDLVIAIDTSASVSGELVQAFVSKTFNILKQSESFFTRINLRIIQCDAAIQEDTLVTTQAEFDQWLSGMTLKGLGGTDFRPVFRYVDDMIAHGELPNLRGLIYFTDGYGTFPEVQPSYEAAFVFIDDAPKVPVWAIKLVLSSGEIL